MKAACDYLSLLHPQSACEVYLEMCLLMPTSYQLLSFTTVCGLFGSRLLGGLWFVSGCPFKWTIEPKDFQVHTFVSFPTPVYS